VLQLLLELLVGPLLVAGSTLACRRWGTRLAGLLSAFPAVVGPVLLIAFQEHGAQFTARAATGTLLGLVALSGFFLAYGLSAARHGWGRSLAAGWCCALAIAAFLGLSAWRVGFPLALAAAAVSLAVAHRVLPSAPAGVFSAGRGGDLPAGVVSAGHGGDIPARMAATAGLVIALAAATQLLGPRIGGVLAALPAIASVLAVCTHRAQGRLAVISLLRGMLAGMAGFAGFCAVVALSVSPLGVAAAFVAATATAVGAQALVALGGPAALQDSQV
jgi:hypothetical protein